MIFVQGRTETSKYNQELQLIGENFADPVELEEQYQDQTCYLRIANYFSETFWVHSSRDVP